MARASPSSFRPTAAFSPRRTRWRRGDLGCQGAQARPSEGPLRPRVPGRFLTRGRSLATAGKDHTVKLWSLTTRRQTARTLQGDLNPVWSLAYSPDGKVLAVTEGPLDAPGTVTLWDLATEGQDDARGPSEGYRHGRVFARWKRLASGGREGTIRIWDPVTGDLVHEITGLSGMTELAFSPDGRLLASAGEGNVVTLWDVASGAEEARLTGFRWPVQWVAFSPDGKLLATGGGTFDNRPGPEGEVKLWDVAQRSVAGRSTAIRGAWLRSRSRPMEQDWPPGDSTRQSGSGT